MWDVYQNAEYVYSINIFRKKEENYREGPQAHWAFCGINLCQNLISHLITKSFHFDSWVRVAFGNLVTSVNSEPIQC